MCKMIRIRQIKVEVEKDSLEYLNGKIIKKLNIRDEEILDLEIEKKSLDARKKEQIYYVYEVNVSLVNEEKVLKKKIQDMGVCEKEHYQVPTCIENKKLNYCPIIVGAGPAGLFSAYILAENGYKPIIIERGERVEDRVKTVEEFWKSGKLNPNSNVQFGEGGAGTFSDGKLNTLIKDKNNRVRKVFETFVECGADKEIMYSYKPHIGTDELRGVIKNLREKIIKLGGEFRYNTCLTNIIIKDNQIQGIEVNNEDVIKTNIVVLAIGHSARDTYPMLLKNKLDMKSKPFAVGLRTSHLQEDIDKSQFGEKYKDLLHPASYKLTYQASNKRGVYSFCMCPGGYVVNASSEKGRLAINGMSNHKRDSKNANSAIVVTVSSKDFGDGVLSGVEFQRKIEEKAYLLGQGKIPVQLLKDYRENQVSKTIGKVEPIFKGEYTFANLNELFEDEINDAIKEAFIDFGKKINCFNEDDTLLAGIESRTSSPVRIERDEFLESNIKGIYPCGEGAGYAGGITSASVDGIKIAEEIIKRYMKPEIN